MVFSANAQEEMKLKKINAGELSVSQTLKLHSVQARTHARTRTRTHARTHTHTQTQTHPYTNDSDRTPRSHRGSQPYARPMWSLCWSA